MTTHQPHRGPLRHASPPLLIAGAILAGLAAAFLGPGAGEHLEHSTTVTLFALVVLILLPLDLAAVRAALASSRLVVVALVLNFLVIAPLGIGLAWLVLHGHPAAMLGLMLYFLAPCTDWFLAFTRIAGGNTAAAAALIPGNLIGQVALFPVVVMLGAGTTAGTLGTDELGSTLALWFVAPIAVAVAARFLLARTPPRASGSARATRLADAAVPWVLAALVLQIFASNAPVFADHATLVLPVLATTVLFLAGSLGIATATAFRLRLPRPDRVALTMTTAARNAPMMLAMSIVAFPDQPVLHATIVLAMLIEFPHLSLLAHVLREQPRTPASRSTHEQPEPVPHR
ncbi:bile acid:sodium symporter [Hoyosella sp. G463]|uniref:Bile acid:sodium symporter n=1 Tax=Lolliginicoccus lacisalsi TaxID=2742202 RepID=A0A927JEX6_9ACTN|nr:bile acid:sodium symporter [Lolliginicoccus lacisalsi]MBD8507192.1 bile acid:sodium symporter [Lolliginicoccus lacisalsi]